MQVCEWGGRVVNNLTGIYLFFYICILPSGYYYKRLLFHFLFEIALFIIHSLKCRHTNFLFLKIHLLSNGTSHITLTRYVVR